MDNHTSNTPLKKCKKCGIEKPSTSENFYRDKNRKDGLYPECRGCANEQQRQKQRAKGIQPLPEIYRDGQKLCPGCKQWKPHTVEFFDRNKRLQHGLSNYCKPCRIKNNKEFRVKHGLPVRPERRDGDLKQCIRCERWLVASGEFFPKHSRSADGLSYYCLECNREVRLITLSRGKDKKRALDKIHGQRRRARKVNLPDQFTSKDWQRALDYFGGKCAVCGRPPGLWHTLAMDHWIPMASVDCPGTVPINIVPLCHGDSGCNNRKGTRDAEGWLTFQFGKRKAKQILKRIEAYFEWIKSQ